MGNNSLAARFLSSYHWTKERDGFGGYSAITLASDGAGFVMLSDRGHLIEGTIFRHGDRVIGVRSSEMAELHLPDSLFGHPSIRDTEGLARDVEGRLYVSVESENRVLRRDLDGTWSALPTHPDVQSLPNNRGLEALAIATDGTVYALPEYSRDLQSPFPVFRFQSDTGWDQPMSISREGGLLPVGADIGPDGRLYVLERGFTGFGFSSRVRRFDISPDEGIPGETLLESEPRRHDNLEGLAVWAASDGSLRLTMVSDDNFLFLQKTEIVEYAVCK
ncbi:MAG: esterase-like activity of phytase family protein [Pelagibaca sp.]